jgi:single-stranded-DNA-specific exonuclease
MDAPRWLIDPCTPAAADALAAGLGVQPTTAEVLVRRGHATPEAARAFLELDGPLHDPMLLGDMAAACERIGRAIAAGEQVCVHGDYDADGICATALALTALRELGANVDWHVPSRFDEGYGLAAETVERLAADGVRLLVTVDCGITAADQVARAAELGMDVIVTDHHRPGDALPDCPRVCTRPSEYPFPELCGTGVVRRCSPGPGAIRPRSNSISTWSPWRRSPTSSRWSTRTAASSGPGCGGSRVRRGRVCGR